MIWKFKFKNSKINRAFTKSDVYTLKFKKVKWERNRSVLDKPTRWADTVRYYWLRFYWEIYLKPDSHKTQRHEGELKANGKSYFGSSIHFSLMTEIWRRLVAVSSAFSGQNWSVVTVVFLLIFHYDGFSRKRYPAKVFVKCQWNKARSHVDQWISTKSWTDPELLVFSSKILC